MVSETDHHPLMPQRVFDAVQPWPLHDAAHSRLIESQALQSSAPHALMARAGLSVARLALAVAPHAGTVTVLVGPGNNGGDALIAALHLHRLGRRVRILHLPGTGQAPADASDALLQARAAGIPFQAGDAISPDVDLIIDGLLGLGGSRPPGAELAAWIGAANASGRPMLAIDLPSGLCADTGSLLGDEAIRAIWTLSLLTLKPGLFTAQGRDHAGEVWHDDLGVATATAPQALLGSAQQAPSPGFAARRQTQHKGSFGDLVVVGGAAGMLGAAVLAARAGLTAGAGRVYLSALCDPSSSALPVELMQCSPAWWDSPAGMRRSTVVCGCGGGDAVADRLPILLAHAGRLVLDADALNAVARSAALQSALQARGAGGDLTVLTPHPLEAARLLACDTARIQADRLAAAQTLSRRYSAHVVLKGSGTVIAAPGQVPWINASGNATLATPGSGDVLAGWLGGTWAQQPAAVDGASGAWLACRASTWLHGRAADLRERHHAGQAGLPLLSSDLIDLMAAALG